MKNRQFSIEQMTYIQARALFEVTRSACRKYDAIMDAECEKLGLATPYGILPDGHAMRAEAQRLLDEDNAAKKIMVDAAHNLFDWATETTMAKMGTETQKVQIRAMVATVKKCAFVEKPFEQLVDMSMRLAA
jgi:N-formylglutamate amidohydrolase